MQFSKLLEVVGDDPLFETGFLLAGDSEPADVRRQLSRWTKVGRILQLRRGLYALAPPYRKSVPHPFTVANRVVQASYVSLQSALAFHGLIPEHVPTVTSMTTGRPRTWHTPLGDFVFRHIHRRWFWGYRKLDLGGSQQAFVATPEKALLDLIHLEPGSATVGYLKELRLQNLDRLNLGELEAQAVRSASPKLRRSVRLVNELVRTGLEEEQSL
jgi:predicted transcriptional regulator of viral defense system